MADCSERVRQSKPMADCSDQLSAPSAPSNPNSKNSPKQPEQSMTTKQSCPKTAHNRSKTTASSPQDAPKTAQDRPKTAQDSPRPPKTAPRPPQDHPRPTQDHPKTTPRPPIGKVLSVHQKCRFCDGKVCIWEQQGRFTLRFKARMGPPKEKLRFRVGNMCKRARRTSGTLHGKRPCR